MGFDGKKALDWKIKYIQAFNEMEKKLLTNENKRGIIEKRTNVLFGWYENISAGIGDTSDINSYAKALDFADYSITHLSELVKYLLQKISRNEEITMQYTNISLDTLKSYLPQYVAQWTQKRKKSTYNCPFCGSGTGKNGTPAFGLYDDNMKFKCQSCGVQGTIIDFYLMTHHMGNSREETAQAIQALSAEFNLTTAPFSPPQLQAPKVKIDERHHIYKNSDGSIFGKKVVNKFSDGSKNAVWYLFNSVTGKFNSGAGLSGQKAPLYHADLLHNNQDERVYLVEGEKDADTLVNWGIISTTVPNGAGFAHWIPLYNEGLQGREIIILTDNDDSGRKYGDTVARNVLPITKSVKVIPADTIWNKCPEKGDISDIVQAVGEEEAQELLIDAINKTNFCNLESLPQYEETNMISTPHQQEIRYTFVRALDVEDIPISFAWFPYLPIGELTIMYASGGTGKSFLTCGIAADITAGRTLPQPRTEPTTTAPANVLFISAEDSQSTLKQRLATARADLSRCFIFAPPDKKEELEQYVPFELPFDKDDTVHISALKQLLSETKPKLVIVDPWTAYVGQKTDMNRANSVRAMTSVLTVIAKEFQCSVLIIAHTNKKLQTENANDAVSGSVDLVNGARSAIAVRTFGDSGHRIMIHTKSNYSELGLSLCYQIINQGRNKPALFQWGEFNSITADDLTTAARSGKKLTDIANDKHDDEEDREIAIEVIKNIAVYGKEVSISYERFREEIENNCGVDFLPKRPAKFMNSLVSDLRACGIGIELKKSIKGILENGEHDQVPKKGFIIRYMTDGYLMADAMPKKANN